MTKRRIKSCSNQHQTRTKPGLKYGPKNIYTVYDTVVKNTLTPNEKCSEKESANIGSEMLFFLLSTCTFRFYQVTLHHC